MSIIQSLTDQMHCNAIEQYTTELMGGVVIPINDNYDALLITMCIIEELVAKEKINFEGNILLNDIKAYADDILNDVLGDNSKHKIKHMSFNAQEDMITLTFTLDTSETYPDEPSYPEDITTPDGVFAYVYNFTVDYFSEYGYVFFKYDVENNCIKRIG